MTSTDSGNAGSAIFVTDTSGLVIGINQEFARVTGRQPQQVLGGPWGALLDQATPLGLQRLVGTGMGRTTYTGAYVRFATGSGPSPWYLLVMVVTTGAQVYVATRANAERATQELGSLYASALAREEAATAAGASLDNAAATGEAAILASLATLGFKDYSDLLRAALPAEVPAVGHLPAEPTDPTLTSVWASALGVDRHLERQQDGYLKLSKTSNLLVKGAADLIEQIEPMEEAATQIMAAARTLSGSATPLTAAHRVSTSVEQSGIRFRALTLGVNRAQELVSTHRMLLAVARLVDRATLETLSYSNQLGQADLGLVVPLVGALHTLAPPLAMGSARVTANLTRLSREATEAAGQVRMLDTTLTSWQLLAKRFDLPDSLIPGDLDAKGAALKLDGIRDLARGAITQSGPDAAAFSEAAAGVARALRYAPGFSFAL
ncbi:MAG: PAS domain-containing protein [Bifidobacteriaceae bacterium]|nr:PAS domain-containing protein [Bifidobacteriaceae bacterium]